MHKNVITISRGYGSGGTEIGRMIADEMKIPFYDKELIEIAAKESGYALDFIEENGEYAKNSLLFHIAMNGAFGANIYSKDNMSVVDKIYIIQSKIIKDIAEKGPCVIIGRCADYILRSRDDCLNLFIYSNDFEFKKDILSKSASENFSITEKEIAKKDKSRASHYKHYTGREWGAVSNYHASFDSSFLGLERTKDIIISMLK